MFSLLIAIAIFDVKFHRIPNIAVGAVVVLDFFTGTRSTNTSLALLLLPIGVFAWRYLKMGGGDIKLLTAILVFVVPAQALLQYGSNLLLCTCILMFIYIVRGRNLRTAVPLGPAISGGYLLSFMS